MTRESGRKIGMVASAQIGGEARERMYANAASPQADQARHREYRIIDAFQTTATFHAPVQPWLGSGFTAPRQSVWIHRDEPAFAVLAGSVCAFVGRDCSPGAAPVRHSALSKVPHGARKDCRWSVCRAQRGQTCP